MNTFASRHRRLCAVAARAGVPAQDVVLPAEGVVPGDGGLGLHYLEWPGAPRPDPVAILLHGGGLQAHTFDVVGLLLRHRIRTVALDLRGHGDSEWAPPGRYGPAAVADDLDQVVANLGARRVVVVGHSLGGLGGIVWAARRRPELLGLVLVDVGATIESEGGQPIAEMVARPVEFRDLEEAHAGLGSLDPALSGVADTVRWTDEGHLTWKHDPAQFVAGGGRFEPRDALLAAAGGIRCPTLVLRGERSRVFSARGAAELVAAVGGGARWEEVPGAGHTIQRSNPRGLAGAVHRFLDELGAGLP